VERPFDLCRLVLSAQASFVARKTAFDGDLSETMAQVLRHDGFAFLDILELCPAYYTALNRYNKSALLKTIEENDLQLGVLKKENYPEYAQQLKKALPKKQKTLMPHSAVKKRFSAKLKNTYEILLAGAAGQKVISAATNLAKAALSCGLFAAQQNEYPVTVQTGFSLSFVKLAAEKIYYPAGNHPQAVIIISTDGLEKCQDILSQLDNKSLVIISKDCPRPKTKAVVYQIDFQAQGSVLSRTNTMVAAISYLLNLNNIIPPQAFKFVLEQNPTANIRQANLRAFEAGPKLLELNPH
jgi:Pyruvate/2-oxoacid:ferredoxin oxidoreductase gamma subunit